jgi:hypothetical protein
MDEKPSPPPASDLLAIAGAMLSFAGLNALWNYFDWHRGPIPYALVVLFGAGSAVALALMVWKVRQGRLTRAALGLGLDGWRADRRLVALVLCAFVVLYASVPPEEPALTAVNVPRPTWGDYCFWFVITAPASLTEVLVFLALPVCLLERRLKEQGHGRFVVVYIPVLVSCVSFGLYHFSHGPFWHSYVLPLTGEMFFVAIYFVWSRNLHLSLLLHNVVAAGGFTEAQYFSPEAPEQSLFLEPLVLTSTLTSFLVPYLLLNVWEWLGQRRPTPA